MDVLLLFLAGMFLGLVAGVWVILADYLSGGGDDERYVL